MQRRHRASLLASAVVAGALFARPAAAAPSARRGPAPAQKAPRRPPDSDSAELMAQARAASGASKYDEAERLLVQLLAASPSVEAKKMLADVRAWKGDLDGAIPLYRELLARGDDPGIVLSLANALSWKKGDAAALDEAVGLYDLYLRGHPDVADVIVQRARVLGWAGRTKDSARAFERVRKVTPTDALLLEEAKVLSQSRDKDDVAQSLPLFEGYLSRHPDDVDARLACARAEAWAGRSRDAAADYGEVRRKMPSDELLLEQAKALAWSKDKVDVVAAVPLLREYLSRHPDDGEARLVLARASSWAGDDAAAEAEFRAYLAMHPDDARARREAAIALALGREPARSLPLFEGYLGDAHARGDAEAKLQYARALLWTNQVERAEQVLDELRREAPSADVEVEYARLLSQTGRRWEAYDVVDRAVVAYPSSAEARALRRELSSEFHSYVEQSAQFYADRNDIRIFWTRTLGYLGITRGFGLVADVAPYSLSDARESLWALQANLGGRVRPHRAFELEAAAGPRVYELFSTHYGGRASLRFTPSPDTKASLDYVYDDAYALLLQPASLSARIWVHSLALTPEARIGRVTLSARGGMRFASPANSGLEASGTAMVRVVGPLHVGYAGQWLAWRYNDPAYWSPQGYASQMGVVRVADTLSAGRFGYDAQVAVGIAGERVEHLPQSDYGLAYAAGAAVLWRPIDRLTIRLGGTYSQTVRELVRDVAGGTSGEIVRIKESSTYSWASGMLSGTLVL